MKDYKIIAVGDNVCDKYLSRGRMYPGGQCVNTCVYAKLNGAYTAYLGKYGSDQVAECVRDTLKQIGIDDSHSRCHEGENGFALVTLKGNDRVFLGSNKGGVAREYGYDFTEEDFSTRWTDAYLEKVCPYVTVAILSCAHLTRQERETEMKKVQSYGVKVVLGTIGEDGSYVLYDDSFLYAPAVHADDVIDTMGAGDSYFAAFLCSLLETSQTGAVVEGTEERMKERLVEAMERGAAFAAKMCAKEGAFGYGVPVLGRTEI